MIMFSKAALAASILATASLLGTANANEVSIDPIDPNGMVEEGITSQPVETTTRNTLIASFSSERGLDSIQSYVAAEVKKGKKLNVKGVKNFRKPQKSRSQGQYSRSGAASSEGGFGSNKRNGGGGFGGNRGGGGGFGRNGGRFLENEAANLGFATIETSDDATDEEVERLSGLSGVTSVQYDVELTVEEVKGLRGHTADDQIQDIMDSMKNEETNLEDSHRRLQEDTPWGIKLVNVTHLWSKTPKQHVKICVIDTGYELGHPDLPSKNVTGWDSGSASKGRWNVDGHSHGTHCAGTIGAIGNNGAGVVGVNPDPGRFSFHIGKGLSDSGSGSGADVINAVNDCVVAGAKVISMSLGCSNCYVEAYDNAYDDAYDAGVLVIAAAGNTGQDTDHYPSAYKSVMSVASVRENSGVGAANYGELSSFSTRNQQTEIAGPGHFVKSTVPFAAKGTYYASYSGTSMATPHVAGVAALLISHFPDCTNNQIRNAMIHSTREPPTGDSKNSPGWDKYYGWGTVNAGNAYELLSLGCEQAGGAYPDKSSNQTLSMQALGGSDQKQMACFTDAQCHDANRCKGIQKCNLASNTCFVEKDTVPICNDNKKCTIDTCDPTRPEADMCVFTPVLCEDGNKCNGIKVCSETDGKCFVDTPPVNCDDSDACTIDTCNTATGMCVITDRTCNDANVCTLNDRCDKIEGCVFQAPEKDCCGNAQCEGDENLTCPQDCSDSLKSSLDPNVARDGHLGSIFNVVAKAKNMTITGFGIHCILPPETPATVYIYTKPGDYMSYWYWKTKWDFVIKKEVTCAGIGKTTQITFENENMVDIPKYGKQGFSIYVLTDDIFKDYPTVRNIGRKGNKYDVIEEDSYLQLQIGSGNRCSNGWCSILSPQAFSGSINYVAIDDLPTPSPTMSIMPTTSISPTKIPTFSPTSSPSVSIAPTVFEPEIAELTKVSSGGSVVRALYFEVTGGDVWAKITDLMIHSYRARSLQVYSKKGDASPYEKTPCAWELVAETPSTWYGSYNKLYPAWKNSFKPVILPPNEKVSFYVVNRDKSYGLIAKYRRASRNDPSFGTNWISLDAASPVGAVSMSYGMRGEFDKPFKSQPSSYSQYALYGGLKLETMKPGTNSAAPTPSPTEPFTHGTIENPRTGNSLEEVNGLQFDVKNLGEEDVIINKFSFLMASTGTHPIEVWYRDGSHRGNISGCDNHNNYCNKWTKLADASVSSPGSASFTNTPTFVVVARAASTTSFVIVAPFSRLLTKAATGAQDDFASNGQLEIGRATPLDDYFGDGVQTIHALGSEKIFEGIIDYDIAHSMCAVQSKASWAVVDPNGSASMGANGASNEDDDENDDPHELDEIYYEPESQDGAPTDGAPMEEVE